MCSTHLYDTPEGKSTPCCQNTSEACAVAVPMGLEGSIEAMPQPRMGQQIKSNTMGVYTGLRVMQAMGGLMEQNTFAKVDWARGEQVVQVPSDGQQWCRCMDVAQYGQDSAQSPCSSASLLSCFLNWCLMAFTRHLHDIRMLGSSDAPDLEHTV